MVNKFFTLGANGAFFHGAFASGWRNYLFGQKRDLTDHIFEREYVAGYAAAQEFIYGD